MNDNRIEERQRLFNEARVIAKADRVAWLTEQCDGDVTLFEHVSRLLDQDEHLSRGVNDENALEVTASSIEVRGTTHHLGCIGRYQLIDRIGHGGMGVVYRARQIGLDRIVALKTILNEAYASADDIARFQTEARAAGNLDHPGIVSVHEIGEHAGRPYYTMDYVPGQTLSGLVAESSLSPSDSAGLTLRVAEAVAHAHENGVIHRDLKPSNILLDTNGNPRVADFGLAKRVDDKLDLTQSGQALGTPNYMSPEQALGKRSDVGPRSDVYGLGAILYALLTGVPPIQSINRAAALRSVIEDLPVPPRSLNPSVDRDLEAICLKCLEKQSDDRYPSVNALIGDLKRYIEGSSVTARPNSYGRILKHWSRRPERIPQSAAIILVVAAFYGISVAVGLCLISLGVIPVSDPVEIGLILTLDFVGFAICLPVGLGMLRRRLWSICLGILSGSCMIIIVGILIWTGFEAGGVLADPFRRASIYSIFGFIGILMVATSVVAMHSHVACLAAIDTGHRDPPSSTAREIAIETTVQE